jgi:phosphatidyl-myo-inositol dimannoside synthase
MRVLALTHVFPRASGDPQAPFLLTWAQALRSVGVQVGVVAPHDAGLPGAHFVDGVGVRLARYAPDGQERLAYRGEMHQLVRSPLGPPLVGALVGALARTVRRQVALAAPDVLHVHWWVPGLLAARVAAVDVPTVLTVHGTDVALLESRPALAAVARWALAAADRVEAVSTDLADRLERTTGRVADAVNPMPLDPAWLAGAVLHDDLPPRALWATDLGRRAAPTDPTHPVTHASTAGGGASAEAGAAQSLRVLAVGRMVPEKGFVDLIDAAARVSEPVSVAIVGDGPLRRPLTGRAAALGVPLSLPGRLSPAELRGAYAAADVVVQASHREGLGLVAAEAACAGTPVVATDSGGVRDVLGADGLVAVGDVDGLAAALAQVAADPAAARGRSAAAAVGLRQRLSPAAAAARTLDGYAALGVPAR